MLTVQAVLIYFFSRLTADNYTTPAPLHSISRAAAEHSKAIILPPHPRIPAEIFHQASEPVVILSFFSQIVKPELLHCYELCTYFFRNRFRSPVSQSEAQ